MAVAAASIRALQTEALNERNRSLTYLGERMTDGEAEEFLQGWDACKRRLIDSPELVDFTEAVKREAAHQEMRWGTDDREAKSVEDWFWLVGYLAGKALRAGIEGDRDKQLHHCISTAAALANWHKYALAERENS